jgi:hypothetical protein
MCVSIVCSLSSVLLRKNETTQHTKSLLPIQDKTSLLQTAFVTMSDNITQEELLTNPKKVGHLLKKMMDDKHGDLDTSPEEMKEIEDDMKERKSSARRSSKKLDPETFTPHGEGPSGKMKVPELEVQSASIHDDEIADGGSDDNPEFHDPDEQDSDSVPETSEHNPGRELVAQESFDLLVESIDTMIKNEIASLNQKWSVESGKVNIEISSMQKKMTSLTAQVNSLAVKLNERSPIVPITTPVATSAKAGPSKESVSTAGAVAPGRKHTARTPSVTEISAPTPRITSVISFLAKHPEYPKSSLTRGLRLRQLAAELGFANPPRDAVPSDWTADNLLSLFTSSE